MPSPCQLLFAALCCIFLGVAKSNVTEEQLHRRLDDEPKTYAMWGDSPWGAENRVVTFDLKTGEAGQVVLGSGGYVAPVAPAVDPATKTLYLPIVEIGPVPDFPFGEPKLVVVNATTEPWTIIRSISLGPRDILIMEYAFFDPVHQRVWVLAMRVDKSTAEPGSEYLWSVDPATNIYEKFELGSFLPPYTIGVTSAVFNPATRKFVLSIILRLGNETTSCSSKGACVPAIAMFDIDRRALSRLTANKEMAATALVWDSNNQEIYSFLRPGAINYPPPYYGRVDAQTGVITLLRKFDDSLFGMVVWGNPLFNPRTGSVIAPLVWYNKASPLNMTFVEPTTGLIKHSFTFTNPGLDQMFIL